MIKDESPNNEGAAFAKLLKGLQCDVYIRSLPKGVDPKFRVRAAEHVQDGRIPDDSTLEFQLIGVGAADKREVETYITTNRDYWLKESDATYADSSSYTLYFYYRQPIAKDDDGVWNCTFLIFTLHKDMVPWLIGVQ